MMKTRAFAILLMGLTSAGLWRAVEAKEISAAVNVNTPTTQSVLPTIQANLRDDLLLDVNNNTAAPVVLDVPEVGVRYQVNPVSDQTFFFNLAQLPDPQTPYYIRDLNGNVLSSGQIVLADDLRAIDTTALNDIINYSTAYNAETKPEPVYYSRPSGSKRYIRGYW